MKTMGGEVWWEVIRNEGRYRLQRHLVYRSHCRILDPDNNSVATGSEAAMQEKFEALIRRERAGLPPQPTKVNIRAKTMGGTVFWETVARQNGYKLQRRNHTDYYRILDADNNRVARGYEDEMRRIFRGLVSGKADPDALRGARHLPNRRHKTMGGEYCWDTIASAGIFRLQKNRIIGNCRILDPRNVCVDYGLEDKMRARLKELAAEHTAFRIPAMGDVIAVSRGAYDHYGVYVSDSEVIEFSPRNAKGEMVIQRTTFAEFIGGSKLCYYLVFPEEYGMPGKVAFSPAVRTVRGIQLDSSQVFRAFLDSIRPNIGAFWTRNVADALETAAHYHLYSPQETVRRARAHIGRDRFGEGSERYSLLRNNCEHFAVWCKTGICMSTQADRGFLRTLRSFSAFVGDIGGAPESAGK